MIKQSELSYYLARAAEEERRAEMSTQKVVRDTHLAFAAAYRDRASAWRSGEATAARAA